jgi:hypothetical protein
MRVEAAFSNVHSVCLQDGMQKARPVRRGRRHRPHDVGFVYELARKPTD